MSSQTSLALSIESNQTDPNSISLNGKRKARSGEEVSVESSEKGKQKVLEEEQESVERRDKGKRIALLEEQESGNNPGKRKQIVLEEEQESGDDQEKERQEVLDEEEEEPVENREKGKQIVLAEQEEELEVDPKYWKLYTNRENGGTFGENDLPRSSSQNNCVKFPKFLFHPIRKEKGNEKRQRMFKCEFCPKTFSNPSAFGGHQNAHRRERAELNRNSEETPSTGFLELYERLGIPPMSSLAGSNNLGFALQSNQPAAVPYFARALLRYSLANNAARRIAAGSALLNPLCFSSNGAGNISSANGAKNDLFSNPQNPGFNSGTMSGLVHNGACQHQRSLSFNGVHRSGKGLPESWSNSFLNPHWLGSNGRSFASMVAVAAGNGAFQSPGGASLSAGPGANSGIMQNRSNTNQNEERVGLYGGAMNNRNGEFWGPPSPRVINLTGGGLGNMLDSNINSSDVERQRNGGCGAAAAGLARNGEGEAWTPPDENRTDIDLTLKLWSTANLS